MASPAQIIPGSGGGRSRGRDDAASGRPRNHRATSPAQRSSAEQPNALPLPPAPGEVEAVEIVAACRFAAGRPHPEWIRPRSGRAGTPDRDDPGANHSQQTDQRRRVGEMRQCVGGPTADSRPTDRRPLPQPNTVGAQPSPTPDAVARDRVQRPPESSALPSLLFARRRASRANSQRICLARGKRASQAVAFVCETAPGRAGAIATKEASAERGLPAAMPRIPSSARALSVDALGGAESERSALPRHRSSHAGVDHRVAALSGRGSQPVGSLAAASVAEQNAPPWSALFCCATDAATSNLTG
jgi:hypothetical protein